MIYNRSIEGNGSLPQYKAKVTTMLKDMDFGVYGKGVDGYVHYSLAMDRIREEEENRNSRLGYWRIAGSPDLKCSITNERLAAAGYFSILNYYESLHICG